MMPVAVAKIVDTNSTPRNSEPFTRARMNWNDRKRRSINPACSRMCPMNMNKGTAARVSSFMICQVWKNIRKKTTLPKPM